MMKLTSHRMRFFTIGVLVSAIAGITACASYEGSGRRACAPGEEPRYKYTNNQLRQFSCEKVDEEKAS